MRRWITAQPDWLPIAWIKLMEPIQQGLEQSFESERLSRWIRECQDIDELREAALALLKQLDQQKSARAWLAARASESENAKLNILAELIKKSGEESTGADHDQERPEP